MSSKSAARLKLHVEDLPAPAPELAAHAQPHLAALCRAFEEATGWQLRLQSAGGELGEVWSAPIASRADQSAGRMAMYRAAAADDQQARAPLPLASARPLALAIGNLLGEMHDLRRAVWQREAELAAGVPVAARADDEPHLAERLNAVLKGGAEAVGCQAAALYLLDEGTSELKLRAAFGLPVERLLAPARPLRGAVADLEALVGHAVVLEDTTLLPHWRSPENFPAAVCVPVSSPTTPLGTLWVFSETRRDFSPEETNLIEIIAGRLAADLDREMLLATGTTARKRDQQFDLAERWQHDRLPSVTPLLDDLEVAGWTRQAGGVGGDFHDWTVLPDGHLALTVGSAQGALLAAGLGAAALQAAIKAHAGYGHDAGQLLARVNETLWTGSAGDQFASLVFALVHPESGVVELARGGDAAGLLLRASDEPWELLAGQFPVVGSDPDARFPAEQRLLGPGDVLVLLSPGARQASDEAGLRIGDAAIATLVARHQAESAERLLARIRHLLDRGGDDPADDRTVVVLKRRA